MNCAFVASYFGPYYSNFVASMLAFHDGMRAKGHDVCYVLPKEAESFEWIGLLKNKASKIYYLKYEGTSLNNIFALRRIFRIENIDLIYSHMCGWDFAAHFASPFTPIVWHMRMGVNLTPFLKRVKNCFKFHFLGFGKTYHVAVSVAVTEIINSLHPRHRCVAIPNALETSRLLQAFATPSTKVPYRMLLFGWSPFTKGLDTALDACEILNKKDTFIELIVSAQEKTFAYLRERFKEGQPAWLKLVPPTSDVTSVYANADLMISASRSEGFSFCLAEALYCGLPVVYSDIPGTSWAGEFKCAHVFKVGDVMDLCRAIRECVVQGITREQQTWNRDLLNKKYSMNAWTGQVVDFLESIPLSK